jgi:hypothetical protein
LLPGSASFLLSVLFDAEDGGGIFISDIGLSLNYIALKSITLNSSLFSILLCHTFEGIGFLCKTLVNMIFLIFTSECCILLRIYLTDSLWCRQSQQSFNTLTPFNFLFYPLHVHLHLQHRQHTKPQRRASYRTKRLRKGSYITTAYVRQAIITGVRQKPPLPTARSPRRWWISRPKNLEDHPDHHEEIQIRHI